MLPPDDTGPLNQGSFSPAQRTSGTLEWATALSFNRFQSLRTQLTSLPRVRLT
jgi:hypothetical protein